MSKSNLHALSQPEVSGNDPLHELIRQGARDLIARAVEAELEGLLNQYSGITTPDGGSRDFPSKNDKVLWKPRHLWPLEGYYFFHIPILALIG